MLTATMLTVGGAGATPARADDRSDDSSFDAALVTSPADAERQSQLVEAENQRLIDIRVAEARRKDPSVLPYRVRSAGFDTLVLPARKDPYSLDDLRGLAPQTFLTQADGSYLLQENILVGPGATLRLQSKRPTTIRMHSGPDGFVSIVTHGGRLQLLGTAAAPLTFRGWDTTTAAPDATVTDGRAYILAEGQLVARHIDADHLGFWSGPTGGLAVTGSEAADSARAITAVDADSLDGLIGEVSDTRITANAFGFFAAGVTGLKLSATTIQDSLVDGLVLHRDANSAVLNNVLVRGSGADGIVITRGVHDTTLTRVTSSDNARDGLVITGKPLAAGPSASGASTLQFGNNVLSAGLLENNGRTGVRVVGGTRVRVLGSQINGGLQGVLVADNATGVTVQQNRISRVRGSAVQVRDSTRIAVSGNVLDQDVTGIHVTDALATVSRNTVTAARLHGISLVGGVGPSRVSANLLSGQGPSALDIARLTDSEPVIADNDTSGWDRTLTRDALLSAVEHPLTAIWLVMALLLLFGQVRFRRRAKDRRAPYVDGPAMRQSSATISADQQEALLDEMNVHIPYEAADPPPTAPITLSGAGGPGGAGSRGERVPTSRSSVVVATREVQISPELKLHGRRLVGPVIRSPSTAPRPEAPPGPRTSGS